MRIPIRALAAIAIALLSAATVAQALAANPCASAAAHRSPTGGTPSHAETMIDALGDGTRSVRQESLV